MIDRGSNFNSRSPGRSSTGSNAGYQSQQSFQPATGSAALDTSKIKLKPSSQGLDAELFNGVAEAIAKAVAQGGGAKKNKPSQLRQFYDELVMWDERVQQTPERMNEFLPFIRMLNAKAAYAMGREHIDQTFLTLLTCLLQQVDNQETLRNAKLFFEAFMGFYKVYGPKKG